MIVRIVSQTARCTAGAFGTLVTQVFHSCKYVCTNHETHPQKSVHYQHLSMRCVLYKYNIFVIYIIDRQPPTSVIMTKLVVW